MYIKEGMPISYPIQATPFRQHALAIPPTLRCTAKDNDQGVKLTFHVLAQLVQFEQKLFHLAVIHLFGVRWLEANCASEAKRQRGQTNRKWECLFNMPANPCTLLVAHLTAQLCTPQAVQTIPEKRSTFKQYSKYCQTF